MLMKTIVAYSQKIPAKASCAFDLRNPQMISLIMIKLEKLKDVPLTTKTLEKIVLKLETAKGNLLHVKYNVFMMMQTLMLQNVKRWSSRRYLTIRECHFEAYDYVLLRIINENEYDIYSLIDCYLVR